MALAPKRWQDSASETVQVVLPNDSNPLGYILGGTVMQGYFFGRPMTPDMALAHALRSDAQWAGSKNQHFGAAS